MGIYASRSGGSSVEAVRYPMAEYADNPLTFGELPDWLQRAIDAKLITPIFRGEDYWYLEVRTGELTTIVGPGDWIVNGADGVYSCRGDVFKRLFDVDAD